MAGFTEHIGEGSLPHNAEAEPQTDELHVQEKAGSQSLHAVVRHHGNYNKE
jgi:hypothetical protein